MTGDIFSDDSTNQLRGKYFYLLQSVFSDNILIVFRLSGKWNRKLKPKKPAAMETFAFQVNVAQLISYIFLKLNSKNDVYLREFVANSGDVCG